MPASLHVYPWTQLWHPEVFALLVLVGAGYLLLVGPLRVRYGLGGAVSRARQAAFLAALAAVYISEGSPIHLISEQFLFSVHMVQHILLTFIFPPLLLMGTPAWLARRVLLRYRPVRAIARVVTKPLVGLALFNLLYSIWHMPFLYNLGVVVHEFHMFEHVVFVSAAVLMWWPIVSPLPELPRLSEPAQILYIFLISVAEMALFGAVTFADGMVYDAYANAPRLWGMSPEFDQQLAGIIMKLGSMAISIPAMAVIFFRWAYREERRVRGGEQGSGAAWQ